MAGRGLGDIYGRAQAAAPSGMDAAIAMAGRLGIPLNDPRGDGRVGTVAPGELAAMEMARKMGLPMPASPGQQAMPSAGANSGAAAVNPVQIAQDQRTNINSLPAPGAPGGGQMQQQAMGGGDPNQHQMTAQAQAAIAEFMRQHGLSQGQRMVENRGVFGGQQQAAAQPPMPPIGLPQLFSGGTVMPPPRRA